MHEKVRSKSKQSKPNRAPYVAVSMNDFGRTICCMRLIDIPPKGLLRSSALPPAAHALHNDRRTRGVLRGCLIAINLHVFVFVFVFVLITLSVFVLVARYIRKFPSWVVVVRTLKTT